MRQIRFKVIYFTLVGLLIISCQKKDITEVLPTLSSGLSKLETNELLKAAINPKNAKKKLIIDLDSTLKLRIVSGDISLDPEKLLNGDYALYERPNGIKQYRRNNLVNKANTTIDILGYTGPCCTLTTRMQTGLKWAVNNYNHLNSNLNFRLSFGSNIEIADIIVLCKDFSEVNGETDLASNQKPGKYIRIDKDLANYSIDVNEHVLTHQIGHAIGLRHIDWNISRCEYENEGNPHLILDSVYILETPKIQLWNNNKFSETSIMNSCRKPSTNGEFSEYDITTIELLYNDKE